MFIPVFAIANDKFLVFYTEDIVQKRGVANDRKQFNLLV